MKKLLLSVGLIGALSSSLHAMMEEQDNTTTNTIIATQYQHPPFDDLCKVLRTNPRCFAIAKEVFEENHLFLGEPFPWKGYFDKEKEEDVKDAEIFKNAMVNYLQPWERNAFDIVRGFRAECEEKARAKDTYEMLRDYKNSILFGYDFFLSGFEYVAE